MPLSPSGCEPANQRHVSFGSLEWWGLQTVLSGSNNHPLVCPQRQSSAEASLSSLETRKLHSLLPMTRVKDVRSVGNSERPCQRLPDSVTETELEAQAYYWSSSSAGESGSRLPATTLPVHGFVIYVLSSGIFASLADCLNSVPSVWIKSSLSPGGLARRENFFL